MKKLKLLLPAMAVVFLASCGREETSPKASLGVAPNKLEFAASGNQSQTLTVTATALQWTYDISASGKEWIEVTKNDNSLVVTVLDNESSEARTGTITVSSTDHEEVRPVGVTVIQAADGSAAEYSISVDPEALTFESDATEPQQVTVTTVGKGLTWTAAAEESAKWLHVEANGDKITVSVDPYDNIETSRSANIVVTPSQKSAKPKAVRVTQKAAETVPSLSVEPSDPIHFKWNEEGVNHMLKVNAVAVKPTVVTENAKGERITWIKCDESKTETSHTLVVSVIRNTTLEPRTGYVVVNSNTEGVDDVKILIEQEAGLAHISNLAGPLKVEDMNPAGGFWYDIFPNQMWDDAKTYTYWVVELWGSGLTREYVKSYAEFSGTGSRIRMKLYSTAIKYNYDEEFALPDGEYNVVPYSYPVKDAVPYTLEAGIDSNDLRIPVGCWYTGIVDGEFVDKAPLTGGKVTVSKDAQDVYTFTFDLLDDAGNAITGTCTSEVTDRHITFMEDNPTTPDPNPNPEDPNDPGFGQD